MKTINSLISFIFNSIGLLLLIIVAAVVFHPSQDPIKSPEQKEMQKEIRDEMQHDDAVESQPKLCEEEAKFIKRIVILRDAGFTKKEVYEKEKEDNFSGYDEDNLDVKNMKSGVSLVFENLMLRNLTPNKAKEFSYKMCIAEVNQ